MHMNLLDLENLAKGTDRQRRAFQVLSEVGLMERLKSHSPVLAGAWPLGLETDTTPISVLCSSENLEGFSDELARAYEACEGFVVRHEIIAGRPAVQASFRANGFTIDVVGQSTSVFTQPAVMLLLIEARLLSFAPPEAREEIRASYAQGSSLEEAFARCFDLPGDAHEELLTASRLTDREILSLTHRFRFRH